MLQVIQVGMEIDPLQGKLMKIVGGITAIDQRTDLPTAIPGNKIVDNLLCAHQGLAFSSKCYVQSIGRDSDLAANKKPESIAGLGPILPQ
jgi:hypothetical protein